MSNMRRQGLSERKKVEKIKEGRAKGETRKGHRSLLMVRSDASNGEGGKCRQQANYLHSVEAGEGRLK